MPTRKSGREIEVGCVVQVKPSGFATGIRALDEAWINRPKFKHLQTAEIVEIIVGGDFGYENTTRYRCALFGGGEYTFWRHEIELLENV